MGDTLKAPFPWFGGKSRVAPVVWERFGDIRNFVEPFFGSGAVLLARPVPFDGVETVNDNDGFLCNFWRAIKHDPQAVAHWADNPVNECDLHARHVWLRPQRAELSRRLEANPDCFDAKIAGWWVWGVCVWIGGGWCNDNISGPWVVENEMFVKRKQVDGVWRAMPHLSTPGNGFNRRLVHLGDAGKGVNKASIKTQDEHDALFGWFIDLALRLERVRVTCGNWDRILGPSVTTKHGLTGVFLDPPYGDGADCDTRLYSDNGIHISSDVRKWAIENGDNPDLRIAFCGYEGEHTMPDSWECHAWKAGNSYGNEKSGNNTRERIWFSPGCLKPNNQNQPSQLSLLNV